MKEGKVCFCSKGGCKKVVSEEAEEPEPNKVKQEPEEQKEGSDSSNSDRPLEGKIRYLEAGSPDPKNNSIKPFIKAGQNDSSNMRSMEKIGTKKKSQKVKAGKKGPNFYENS